MRTHSRLIAAFAVPVLWSLAGCATSPPRLGSTQDQPTKPSAASAVTPHLTDGPPPVDPPLPSPSPQWRTWRDEFDVVTVEDRGTADLQWQGSLVVNGPSRPAIVKLPSMARIPLPMVSSPSQVQVPAVVSPDTTRVAYLDGAAEPERLFIVDAEGIEHPVPAWPEGRSWATISWPNESALLLGEYWVKDGSLFALDPSTGSLLLLPPIFPTTSDDGDLRGGEPAGLPFVYYDASLQSVAVPRFLRAENRHTVELWSVPTDSLVWKAHSWGTDPKWAPNGDHVAVVLRADPDSDVHECAVLAVVDHHGRETPLHECVWLGTSWSPDGSTIAAWRAGDTYACPEGLSSSTLMILNLEAYSRRTLRICADESRAGIKESRSPIWSPDGNYLALNRYDYQLDPVDSLVIDLANNKAYVIPHATEVAAWIW